MGRVLGGRDRMRGILHHPSGGRRRSAGPRTRLLSRRTFSRRTSGKASGKAAPPQTGGIPSGQTGGIPSGLDFAAQRVRAAGGPTDEASYTCTCGYVFSAPVSATVACPHCGCQQEW